ncbi:hypothetical protein [Absicoccus intestinalis]|uniref:Uncharacterized protein n=1 Tax=Absicoccus intestinalis TaxID=2926319 RepID=A0ABU4WLD5_9FIRM|nr:hypothetical protein [Absicoccus sp. CLA-KB-P134]MDX8417376.1 hypothetical protein [Absicoccus sp. CLA-KB-P134]
MEYLKITSGRNFSFHNREFHVADLPKQDQTDGNKYMIQEVMKDGSYNLCFNELNWDLLKFPTIKEARRFVSYEEWCIKSML